MRRLVCPALVLAFVLIALACGGSLPYTGKEKPPIPYEILEDTTSSEAPLPVLSVLVDEKTTKEQALKLADYLLKKHRGHLGSLNIFDSQAAWKGSKDPAYPESQLDRHWLVNWESIADKDGKPRWEAKARDH